MEEPQAIRQLGTLRGPTLGDTHNDQCNLTIVSYVICRVYAYLGPGYVQLVLLIGTLVNHRTVAV